MTNAANQRMEWWKKRQGIAILLTALAILVAYIFLGASYLLGKYEVGNRQKQLAEAAQGNVGKRPVPQSLEHSLMLAEARLVQAQFSFPAKEDGTAVLADLLRYARESGVQIAGLKVQSPVGEAVGTNSYPVIRLQIQGEGGLPDILAFIRGLEEGKVNALAIDRTSLKEEKKAWSVGMHLSIYTRPLLDGAYPKPEEKLKEIRSKVVQAWQEGKWDVVLALAPLVKEGDSYPQEIAEVLYSIHMGYGAQLVREGQQEKAAQQFREALRLIPGDGQAQRRLEELALAPKS